MWGIQEGEPSVQNVLSGLHPGLYFPFCSEVPSGSENKDTPRPPSVPVWISSAHL